MCKVISDALLYSCSQCRIAPDRPPASFLETCTEYRCSARKQHEHEYWSVLSCCRFACCRLLIGSNEKHMRILLATLFSFAAIVLWGFLVLEHSGCNSSLSIPGIYNTVEKDELRGPDKLLPKPDPPEEGWTEENPEPADEYEKASLNWAKLFQLSQDWNKHTKNILKTNKTTTRSKNDWNWWLRFAQ